MAISMAEVHTPTNMETAMRGSFVTVTNSAKESILGLMVATTRVNIMLLK